MEQLDAVGEEADEGRLRRALLLVQADLLLLFSAAKLQVRIVRGPALPAVLLAGTPVLPQSTGENALGQCVVWRRT